jgi:hypothetical protein
MTSIISDSSPTTFRSSVSYLVSHKVHPATKATMSSAGGQGDSSKLPPKLSFERHGSKSPSTDQGKKAPTASAAGIKQPGQAGLSAQAALMERAQESQVGLDLSRLEKSLPWHQTSCPGTQQPPPSLATTTLPQPSNREISTSPKFAGSHCTKIEVCDQSKVQFSSKATEAPSLAKETKPTKAEESHRPNPHSPSQSGRPRGAADAQSSKKPWVTEKARSGRHHESRSGRAATDPRSSTRASVTERARSPRRPSRSGRAAAYPRPSTKDSVTGRARSPHRHSSHSGRAGPARLRPDSETGATERPYSPRHHKSHYDRAPTTDGRSCRKTGALERTRSRHHHAGDSSRVVATDPSSTTHHHAATPERGPASSSRQAEAGGTRFYLDPRISPFPSQARGRLPTQGGLNQDYLRARIIQGSQDRTHDLQQQFQDLVSYLEQSPNAVTDEHEMQYQLIEAALRGEDARLQRELRELQSKVSLSGDRAAGWGFLEWDRSWKRRGN